MSDFRNPAELLGYGCDAAIGHFLRAAGAEEAVVQGQVSDYDAFLALADALVLYEGHPLAGELHRRLCAATGVSASLCPHTARAHWDAWVARHWYGWDAAGKDVCPTVCPHCAPAMTQILDRAEVMEMPAPETLVVAGDDIAWWSERMCACIPRDGKKLMVTLPTDYRFVRPDAYHAGLAIRAAGEGQATEDNCRLLYAQALRVVGDALRETGGQLVLCGGEADDVLRLIGYLTDAKCLPRLVWLSDDPMAVAKISGMNARVETGLRIPRGADEETVLRMLAVYATVAPIGRCVVWRG